eukprot:4970758-Pyramimonas_sp.AAC.1
MLINLPAAGGPFRAHWREGGKICHPWVAEVASLSLMLLICCCATQGRAGVRQAPPEGKPAGMGRASRGRIMISIAQACEGEGRT